MKTFPLQPCDDEGPVFNEPWQAQAFGLVVALHQRGLFSWEEWAEQLSKAIVKAQGEGDPDLGDTYYSHWLSALEQLATAKGFSSFDEIESRADQWRDAYLDTPHGQPVVLPENKS